MISPAMLSEERILKKLEVCREIYLSFSPALSKFYVRVMTKLVTHYTNTAIVRTDC